MAVQQIGDGRPDGSLLGASATEKLGFYGATTVVQPASASQAICTNTTTTTCTTTALQTDLDAVRLLVNQLRADLIELGLIKGAA